MVYPGHTTGLFRQCVVEPAVIDSDPAVFLGRDDIDVAPAEADVRIVVGFSGVHSLRCNNIVAGHHHDQRNVQVLEIRGGQSVKRALLVDNVNSVQLSASAGFSLRASGNS